MDPLPNPGIAYTTNSLFPISAMITNDIPMKKSDNEKTEDIIHTLCIESWCHYPLHSGFPDHLQDTITDFVNTLPVEERSQCLKVRLELNDVLREFVTDGNRPYTSEKQQELFGRLNVIYEELPNEIESHEVLFENFGIFEEHVNSWRQLHNADIVCLEDRGMFMKYINTMLDLLNDFGLEKCYFFSQGMSLKQLETAMDQYSSLWDCLKDELNHEFCLALKMFHYQLPVPVMAKLTWAKNHPHGLTSEPLNSIEECEPADDSAELSKSESATTVDESDDNESDAVNDVSEEGSVSSFESQPTPNKPSTLNNNSLNSVQKLSKVIQEATNNAKIRPKTKKPTDQGFVPLVIQGSALFDSDDDLMFAANTTCTSSGPSAKRKGWTPEEMASLIQGIKRYGVGKWADIREDPRYKLKHKTNVQIKDKWRNMCSKDAHLARLL